MESKQDELFGMNQFYLQQCNHPSCSIEVKVLCQEWDLMDYSSAVNAIEEFKSFKSILILNCNEQEPFKGPFSYISKDENIQIILGKYRDT